MTERTMSEPNPEAGRRLKERALNALFHHRKDLEEKETARHAERWNHSREQLMAALVHTFGSHSIPPELQIEKIDNGSDVPTPGVEIDGLTFYWLEDRLQDSTHPGALYLVLPCARCGDTARSVAITLRHADGGGLIDIGRALEQAQTDPPICQACRGPEGAPSPRSLQPAMTDAQALDEIAELLSELDDWPPDLCGRIADLVREAGRCIY